MTERRKLELTRKFFNHSLSEEEVAELSDALKEDEEFTEELRFDVGAAKALERQRYDKVNKERRIQLLRRKAMKIAGALTLLLLLGAILYATLSGAEKDAKPLTPAEGLELMNDLVAKAKSDRRLGVIAGRTSWRDLLAKAPLTSSNLRGALVQFKEFEIANGRCDNSEIALFRGAIEAYVELNFSGALTNLECLSSDADYLYLTDAELPSIISLLGGGKVKEAKLRFLATGWPIDTLPPTAAAIITAEN